MREGIAAHCALVGWQLELLQVVAMLGEAPEHCIGDQLRLVHVEVEGGERGATRCYREQAAVHTYTSVAQVQPLQPLAVL